VAAFKLLVIIVEKVKKNLLRNYFYWSYLLLAIYKFQIIGKQLGKEYWNYFKFETFIYH